MKVEITVNGRFELVLLPEDGIDETVLKEMTMRAERGQPVTLRPVSIPDGVLTVVGHPALRAVISVER